MKFALFAAVAAAFVLPTPQAAKELVLNEDARLNIFSDKPVANQTIYEVLSTNNDTTQFVALVNRFADLVELLNTTAAVNYTVFAPVDTAFEKLPVTLPNTTAVIRNLVSYHIGLGGFPFSVMFNAHTIPTLVKEPLLGGEPQRLRVRFEKHAGLSVNFDSHVVTKDLLATNGVVHTVDSVVLPPVPVAQALALQPAEFSTYLSAIDKTNFTDVLAAAQLHGATVLAPSNIAFVKLGPKINEFLFVSPEGAKYLEALLKYSIAPNATVYSDAFYGPAAQSAESEEAGAIPVIHRDYDLPTLLADATVSINVTAYVGYTSFLVNTIASVFSPDAIARNGVIQEVSSVVFPPAPAPPVPVPGYPWWKYKQVKTVEDVIERLGPYVKDDTESSAGEAARVIGDL